MKTSNLKVGYYGRPGHTGGVTHFVSDGKPICGTSLPKGSEFQWCEPEASLKHSRVECGKCRAIQRAKRKTFISLKEAYAKATKRPLKVKPGYVKNVASVITPEGCKFIEMGSVNCALIAHSFNVLPEVVEALDLMRRHYEDLGKSNPGFMGKLTLQDYGLWNKALLAMDAALAKASQVEVAP